MKNSGKKTIKPMGLNFAIAERPLIEALKMANDGDALVEASDELTAVVRAVRDNGGKGTVTLKIAVGGQGKAVAMKVSIASTKPKPDRPATKLFADETGRLGMHDPDQYQMEEVLDEAESRAPAEPVKM